MSEDWQRRWHNLEKILKRAGPFAHPDFNPLDDALNFILEVCKVLVVGAGGLGCELLKNLALMGFRNIDVIDMDTIDISNLNRQFLFRSKDIGKSKAEVSAAYINSKVPGCKVTPQFHIVVCGLDSIVARRWINGMLISLLNYEDGMLDESTLIPLVDGGTEGFKGNVRIILPGITACIECTLDLYPPQVTYPLCTIAHTPRLPEHCVEYVRMLQWQKENPFGEDVAIDEDDVQHIQWIYEKALERANQAGVTLRLTHGVIKHIIPAVASTNAVIAAACATEVFKLATNCCQPLNNYMIFNDSDGVYTYTFTAERKEDCVACSQIPQKLSFSKADTLQHLLDYLTSSTYQMKNPGITAIINGKSKTLYMHSPPSLEEITRNNLKKSLSELGLINGQQIVVVDVTSPLSLRFNISLNSNN